MGGGRLQVAGLAALAFVVIALLGAIATYIDNYYTESVGQWVANDLRLRPGQPGEFHPQLPTEPYVTLSSHTARASIWDLPAPRDFCSSSWFPS